MATAPNVAKSGKGREIPLDDEMIETLSQLREEASHRQAIPGSAPERTAPQEANFSREHVFVTTVNTPWGHNLLHRFYTYARKAGIDDARPRGAVDLHSLRGTFVTHAIDNGASPKAVQDIVGHLTLALTMNTYARATDQGKRAAISSLPFAKASVPAHLLKLVPAELTPAAGYTAGTKALASS
jgi:integrase